MNYYLMELIKHNLIYLSEKQEKTHQAQSYYTPKIFHVTESGWNDIIVISEICQQFQIKT